jgi:hypothetical protein
MGKIDAPRKILLGQADRFSNRFKPLIYGETRHLTPSAKKNSTIPLKKAREGLDK